MKKLSYPLEAMVLLLSLLPVTYSYATKYVIYGGDATQDGFVDGSDMAAIDNASTALLVGYVPEDVNGDGIVDGSDMALIDNNSTAVVHAQIP